jgi:RimJ/RimL family protein N-acetyltransferase
VSGIRSGDRLFIVADRDNYLHRGYVIFNGRAKKLIDEPGNVPLIGYCYTAAAARGRGLYRRALLAEMRYLQELGYKRVVIDTHPVNHASRKGIEAAGFAFVRTVSAWIVLNLFAIRRTETGHNTRWRVVFFLGSGDR